MFACEAGACTSPCMPGARSCNGNTPRTCVDGVWIDALACADQTCVDGTCTGVCVAATRRCVNNTPELCDAAGQWVAAAACDGQTCVSGACQGVCRAGQTRCRADGKLETCTPTGQWDGGQTCPFVCQGGVCAGECWPGERRCHEGLAQRCSDSYAWVTEQTCSATWGCANGLCCESNDRACPGTGGAACGTTVTKDCGVQVQCGTGCVAGFTCGGNPARPQTCGCAPGQLRCDAGQVLECDAAGAGWTVVGPCECTPGARRCLLNDEQTCGDNFRWPPNGGSSRSCKDLTCVDGVGCSALECKEGQIRCIDERAYEQCIGGQFGCGFAGCSSCADIEPGYVCLRGDGLGDRCGCKAGTLRCNQNTIERCDTSSKWQPHQECGNFLSCCEDCRGGATCTLVLCPACEVDK
jgi:hypothetical protein